MNYFKMKSMSKVNLKFMETIFEVWIKIYKIFVQNDISQKSELMIKMTPWQLPPTPSDFDPKSGNLT